MTPPHPHSEVRATTLSAPLPGTRWTLRGVSRSTAATSFSIPELGIVIDAGTKVHTAHPDHIFITHTHNDHTFDLPRMRSRRKPPVIAVPEHAVELTESYFDAAQRLTASVELPEDFAWTRSYDLVGVAPGSRLPVGRSMEVDVIGCDHSVPCVGYLFHEVRQKLKPAFEGRSGAELGALRREGVVFTERVRTPVFAFLGDTTPEVYAWHPELLTAPVIVGECTFLHPEHRETAWARKHTHFEDLRVVIEANPEVHFVLTHFSLRYSDDDVRAFFDAHPLPNITPWVATAT